MKMQEAKRVAADAGILFECANEESWKFEGERPMPVEHFIAMDTHRHTTGVCVKGRGPRSD
jgi:hypothetical protein